MQAAARSTLLAYPVGGEEDWLGKQLTPTVPIVQLEAPLTTLDLRTYRDAGAQARLEALSRAAMFVSEHSAVNTLLGTDEAGSHPPTPFFIRCSGGGAKTSRHAASGEPPGGVRYEPFRYCGLFSMCQRARFRSIPLVEGLIVLPLLQLTRNAKVHAVCVAQ